MGGPSAEHEISLGTGKEMLQNLDTKKYIPKALVISQKKELFTSTADPSLLKEQDFSNPQSSKHFAGPFTFADSNSIWDSCDCALLALHGEFGEDGKIQGFFDTLDIPYTGSGVYASAVGMEKITAKIIFEEQGIKTPPYSVYCTETKSPTISQLEKNHGYPCFVKCPQSGSSRLMGRAQSREELEQLLNDFSAHSSTILIETAINGEEYSCPVLAMPDNTAQPLLPVLIRPVSADFFDYTAKYAKGGSEEIVPAPISEDLAKRMQKIALTTHKALKCSGVSRTDMIVQGEEIYTLEINTLPGFTPASLVPKSFAAMGGTFSSLLDILIDNALKDRSL